MNFVDYLIATRNYSALKAMNNYIKMFARTNKDIRQPEFRSWLARNLNQIREIKDENIREEEARKERNRFRLGQKVQDEYSK